jgi:hypothetical protein
VLRVWFGGDRGTEVGMCRAAIKQRRRTTSAIWRDSHSVAGVPEEGSGTDESGSRGIADEERRDHKLQLVCEACGKEPRVDILAAFHHQPPDAPSCQVGHHVAQVERTARKIAELRSRSRSVVSMRYLTGE